MNSEAHNEQDPITFPYKLRRKIGVLLFFCLFSTFLHSQNTIESQISLQEKAELYVEGRKIENEDDLVEERNNNTQKTKIYVVEGTLVSNLESENIEIVAVNSDKHEQPAKFQKITSSEKVKQKTIHETKEKQVENSVVTTVRPIPVKDMFRQPNGRGVAAIPTQNSHIKQLSAINTSVQWNLPEIILSPEDDFYEIPYGISSYCLSSFSIRPPPYYHHI